MYLFFDTETSGLPKNWKAPISDVDNWPRLVQIGWMLTDEHGESEGAHEYIIKPDGFTISRGASDVHGITTERALAEGVDIGPVLEAFRRDLFRADALVAHNVQFDETVLGAEYFRLGLCDLFSGAKSFCTMKGATDFCRIPGRRGYKWPTLTELHEQLFHEPFTGAHGALADCTACKRCFFRLRELGVLA